MAGILKYFAYTVSTSNTKKDDKGNPAKFYTRVGTVFEHPTNLQLVIAEGVSVHGTVVFYPPKPRDDEAAPDA